MLKSEKFLLFVEEIVMGKHSLFSYEKIRANPECLNQVMNHMKETVSVWEDTRKLANLKYIDDLDGFGKKVKGIIKIRLGFIQNKYEPNMYAKGRFIRNFDNYKKFFTENAIKKALSNVGPDDFTSKVDAYECEDDYYLRQGYPCLGECSKEEWIHNTSGPTFKVIRKGHRYIVPDKYQLKEANFLRDCMLYDYPYMKKYFNKCDIRLYHLDNPFEFYITVSDYTDKRGYKKEGTLYIPFVCLKEKSIKYAVERMTKYFNWYYKDEEERKIHLGLMDCDLFKELSRDIENK